MAFELHSPFPLFAHDSDGAQRWDSKIISSGTPGFLLMMRAAQAAVNRLVAEMGNHPEMKPNKRKPVIILAGPGNNGGDGYGVAALLKLADIDVRVLAFGKSSGDAFEARRLAVAFGVPVSNWAGRLPQAAYYIDALLGTGLSRAPGGDIAAAIVAIGRSKNARILSLDVPSGLDPTGGRAFEPCISADMTISFLVLKQGLLIGAGPEHTGQLYFDDLGFPLGKKLASAIILSPRACAPSMPEAEPHKDPGGSVLLLAGDENKKRAAPLVGLAALQAGADKVYWAGTDKAELTDRPPDLIACEASSILSRYKNMQVIIAGSRLARDHDDWLEMLWRGSMPIVFNAEPLEWLAETMPKKRRAPFIATVDPDETAVLPGGKPEDRFKALKELNTRFGGVWILTGAGILISGHSKPVICPFAGSALDTAGADDILAGILGGLWSRAPSAKALQIACAGVHIYTQAAILALEEKRGGDPVAGDFVDHISLAN